MAPLGVLFIVLVHKQMMQPRKKEKTVIKGKNKKVTSPFSMTTINNFSNFTPISYLKYNLHSFYLITCLFAKKRDKEPFSIPLAFYSENVLP